MPHLRLYVPEEWLADDFRLAAGFDASVLLDLLVTAVADLRMENPGAASPGAAPAVPVANLHNLKHAIIGMRSAHVGGDASKYFIHVVLAIGNDTPGRTAEVRSRIARLLGEVVDRYTADLPNLASVTVHVQDIDRARGYSTTAERRNK